MFTRGSIPRAVTASGILALLGLALILLPMAATSAQDDDSDRPEKKERDKRPPKKDRGDFDAPPGQGDRRDLERRLDQLEDQLHDLLRGLHELRRDLGIKGKGRRPLGPPDGEGGPRKKGPPEGGRKKGPPEGDRKKDSPEGEEAVPRKKDRPKADRKPDDNR